MQLNQQIFKKLFQEYANYCKRGQWLTYHESNKFKFGRWLNQRVNFETQTDEDILKICIESQDQAYHEDWGKGIKFILSIKQYNDDFITLEIIKILRQLYSGQEIEEKELSNTPLSFPKFSVWAGILMPDKYMIFANEELTGSIAYLFDLKNYPRSGLKSFQLANSCLKEISKAIQENFNHEELELIQKIFPSQNVLAVDRVWLAQDFTLFLNHRILSFKRNYFWINQGRSYEDEKKQSIIATSNDNIYHHKNLKVLKEGDYLIHYANKGIVAISEVTKEFEIKPRPGSDKNDESIVVDVRYFELNNLITDTELKQILSTNKGLIPKQQSPFDKNLHVAQKYCCGINEELFNALLPYHVSDIESMKKRSKTINPIVTQATLPLNQILYGPPGTGKTYHTINRALEIIEGSEFCKGKPREDLLKRFNQLKEEGRIGFVTFHQSFSYEDFVEGITPQLVQNEDANQTENEDTSQTENGEVKYELKEGIFKRLSRMAGGVPFEKVNKEHHYDFDSARFFKMSIGGKQKPHIHDWCIKNGKIALGWGGDANFRQLISSVGNWREFRDRFKVEYPHLVEESKFHVQAMHAFMKMRKGDVVLVSKGNNVIDAVGVIKDDEYIYDDQQDFGYYQFRNIDWVASNLNVSPELFVSKKISQQTIYEFFDEDIKREYFKKTFNSDPKNSSPENYVLIIDEINRGNVAAIFGELITLIEPDKRLGNAEALQAQLPYSKEWFGVPANLYIVGTMNTADRSVEALDTALRRRFSFEEILPNPALISELCVHKGIIGGVDLGEILTVINDRIEALVDRDHTIGHSYFLHVNSENDLRLVFKDKIVPLLQEYFFGDFGKIGLVLGAEFVEKVPEVTRFAVIDGYEDIAYLQKERFRLKPINNEFPIIKALSILLGKTDQQG